MLKPLVSIIISVYNTEKYLKQCLNSVIKQSFKDIEIIIINDYSNDNSYKIIDEFKIDNRIVVINLTKNLGLGFARNKGLEIARGEYVAFVDADDWIKEDFIQILYTAIKKHDADFVSANYLIYDNITTNIFENKPCTTFYKHTDFYNFVITNESIKKEILLNTPNIYLWTKIFKKSFLTSNNIYFKIRFFEDNLFIWEAIANAKKFLFIDIPIYYYRINRENSFVYNHQRKFIIYNSTLFKALKKSLLTNNIYTKYKKEYFSYISIRTLDFMEISKLSFTKLTVIFFKFRKNFYTNDYQLSYNTLNLKSKFKLLSFQLCLKFNINYILFVKFYRFYKFIKSIVFLNKLVFFI